MCEYIYLGVPSSNLGVENCSYSSVGQSVWLLTTRSEVRPLLRAQNTQNTKPAWRNWIARRTSNPEVASSSLAVGTPPQKQTVCPRGLRGQTQVLMCSHSWVQIPLLSCIIPVSNIGCVDMYLFRLNLCLSIELFIMNSISSVKIRSSSCSLPCVVQQFPIL